MYPGTVKEGYLVKSPPLDRKGVKVMASPLAIAVVYDDVMYFNCSTGVRGGVCSPVQAIMSHHACSISLIDKLFLKAECLLTV